MNHTAIEVSFFTDFWRRINRASRFSAAGGLLFAALAIPAGLGIFIDPRLVTGEPVWLKPFKFLISSVLYAWTFAWFLSFINTDKPWRRKWVGRLGVISVSALFIEIAVIVFQAARGVTSHFNVATPLNAALWSVMAWTIIVLWTANLAAMVMLLRQGLRDRAFDWSLRLGIIIASIGMLAAFYMPQPTPPQLETMMAGKAPTIIGAHTVGAPDGVETMALTHWNKNHGDLRIPHFFSLHAMQALPLFGWWITRRRRYSADTKMKMVWAASLWFFAIFLVLTVQALLGQGLLAPSREVLAGFVLTTLLAALSMVTFHFQSNLKHTGTDPVPPEEAHS